MASFFNRFRRRPADSGAATPPVSPEAASTQDAESKHPPTADTEKHSGDLDPEKHDPEIGITNQASHDDEDEENLPEDVRELPKVVRSIVSLEDDPNAPTLSFRYFILCFIFVPPGAILGQMGLYRTTAAVYPVLFVQIGESNIDSFLVQ